MPQDREPSKPKVAVLEDEAPLEAPASEPPPTFVQSLRRFLVPIAAGCLFLLVFGVGAATSMVFLLWPEPTVERGGSLVVLPLVHADDDAAGAALTRALIDDLSTEAELDVISYEISATLSGDERGVDEIGADLGVRYALDGKIKPRAAVVDVDLRLSNVEGGFLVFNRTFSKPLGDEEALRASIVEAILEGTLVHDPADTPSDE